MQSSGKEGHLNSRLGTQRCVAEWGQNFEILYTVKVAKKVMPHQVQFSTLETTISVSIFAQLGGCSKKCVGFGWWWCVFVFWFFFLRLCPSSYKQCYIYADNFFFSSYPLVRCQLKQRLFCVAARQQMWLAWG